MKGISWDITEKTDLNNAVGEILQNLKSEKSTGSTVLALHGDLGAGKTTFVQSLAKEVGVSDVVTSPTFVIMKKYSTESSQWPNLVHIDAYRLDEIEELKVLGLEGELSDSNNLICIEWAEKVKSLLPENTINLYFSLAGSSRKITLEN